MKEKRRLSVLSQSEMLDWVTKKMKLNPQANNNSGRKLSQNERLGCGKHATQPT
jgi:hypothetical protein